MKKALPVVLTLAFLCFAIQASSDEPKPNSSAKWGVGWVDSDVCCEVVFGECADLQVDEAPLYIPPLPTSLDIYLVAVEVNSIDGTRFGICAAFPENINFYGWTSKADVDDASAGWPGPGEGIDLSWGASQAGPFVVLGVLHVYATDSARLCLCPDPRVGYAEWRDGTTSVRRKIGGAFGCVGFGPGKLGYNPCGEVVPAESMSWGAIKSLYRR